MTLQRKIGFWLAAFLALGVVVYVLRDVLMPFVAGLVLAYLLDPLADRLERAGMGRLGASVTILVLFVAFFVAILVVVAPLLATQTFAFLERAPTYVTRLQALMTEQGAPFLQRIGGDKVLNDLQKSLGDVMGRGMSWLGAFLGGLWSGGQAIIGILSLLVVTPVVAFYLLLDWDRMIATVDSWVPVNQRETVRDLARKMDRAISGFLRGQTIVCLLLGSMYAAGLFMVGLNFGILIGLAAGLMSFIPYVGSLLGLVVAVGVAIAQFWPDFTMIGLVLAVFVVGQFIEGNILAPKLVGESVGLHPVWLMFALLAGGSLFGFLGLLLAVPVAAAAGVLIRFALAQYLVSPLHGGSRTGEAAANANG